MIKEYIRDYLQRVKMLAYDTLRELSERPTIGGGVDLPTIRFELSEKLKQTTQGLERNL
tara:strand:+ start:210 stop:386 length:177 start_codon:yes stop_codon:yes gene_type:complete